MLLRKGDFHPHTSRYAFFFCTTMKNTLDRRITIVLSLCNIKVAAEATGRKNLLKTESHTKCDPGVHTFALLFLTFIGETLCEKGVCHWIVNNVLIFILGTLKKVKLKFWKSFSGFDSFQIIFVEMPVSFFELTEFCTKLSRSS